MEYRLKKYLSWSQLDLFLRDPEEYRRVYVRGENKRSFAPLEQGFGKKIADGLLQDEMTGEAEIDFCRASLPPVDQKDKEEMIYFGEIPLLIRCDGVKFDPLRIDEYKTGHPDKKGKNPWDQKRADSHRQIDFYVFAYFLKTKKIADANLIWIPTKKIDTGSVDEENREIYRIDIDADKDIEIFPVKKDIGDMARMADDITKVWKEIGAMVREELNN